MLVLLKHLIWREQEEALAWRRLENRAPMAMLTTACCWLFPSKSSRKVLRLWA